MPISLASSVLSALSQLFLTSGIHCRIPAHALPRVSANRHLTVSRKRRCSPRPAGWMAHDSRAPAPDATALAALL